MSAVLKNTVRHKKVDLFKKLVHSNSCQADQDIAASGTNSQIGTPSNDVPMGSEIPVPWSITESQRFIYSN